MRLRGRILRGGEFLHQDCRSLLVFRFAPPSRIGLAPVEFAGTKRDRSPPRGHIRESAFLPGKQRRRWTRGESFASSESQLRREFPLSSGNYRAFGRVQREAELPGAPR